MPDGDGADDGGMTLNRQGRMEAWQREEKGGGEDEGMSERRKSKK